MTRLMLVGLMLALPASAQDGFATYRGNAQRTGCADGKAGPAKPSVEWVFRSDDHFVASPVPAGNSLIVSGLGAFNRPAFLALPFEAKANPEPSWLKSSPPIKLPTVSSPAVYKNLLIFGDGMHQTDGALIYGLPMDGGKPLWKLSVPGTLVHAEGGPCVVGDKAYFGAGNAGVFCIDLAKLELAGKELSPEQAATLQAKKWDDLKAEYAEKKKKDPDFAIPPGEDQLLPIAPKVLWQVGKEKWHVDAPVNFADGKLFVTSSFLDKEKTGDRAVFCLDAATGKELWRTPIPTNPWGGVTIDGDKVILATCSVSYDHKLLKGAKGEVMALSAADGKPLWTKPLPTGGVLGCVAVADGLAVTASTDGKVRVFGTKDGERKFIYDCKAPVMAPMAVSAGVAYVADCNGVLHAVDLKSGSALWTLDLAADPVKAPGGSVGGPIVHGGKIYLATSNLDGPFARKPTAVIRVGTK